MRSQIIGSYLDAEGTARTVRVDRRDDARLPFWQVVVSGKVRAESTDPELDIHSCAHARSTVAAICARRIIESREIPTIEDYLAADLLRVTGQLAALQEAAESELRDCDNCFDWPDGSTDTDGTILQPEACSDPRHMTLRALLSPQPVKAGGAK